MERHPRASGDPETPQPPCAWEARHPRASGDQVPGASLDSRVRGNDQQVQTVYGSATEDITRPE